jgi:PncC family amidohydrolase
LIGHLLTEVAGSSAYYVGGLVSYSNALKEAELGVPRETLERHGAVSAQTAVAMADGARRRYGASVAVAVTGIAGPDGGTPQKPVGLTYVAVADAAGHDVRRHVWDGDRHANKLRSVAVALELVLERLAAA